MSNTLKQIFVPDFLRKIDQHLLLKYPLIWNSKIHYVAYYCMLTWLAMATFGLLVSNVALNSDFIGFYWLLSVLSVIAGIVIWLVFLFRHNSTKQFGNRVFGREWINLFSHYICLLLITSCLYVMPFVKIVKSHLSIQKDNIVERVNVLNINGGFFPDGEYDLQQLYAVLDQEQITAVSFKLSTTGMEFGESDYQKLDPKLCTYYDISDKFSKIQGSANIKKGVEDYIKVLNSFGIAHPYKVEKITALMDDTLAYRRDYTFEAINSATKSALHRQIDAYFRPIYRFNFLLEGEYYFGWLLVVLPILLISLTIFRNTALKFYFISIGVTIVLVIINAMFIGLFFSDYENKATNLISLMVFFAAWALVLGYMSTKVFQLKQYRVVNAYAVFLWNLLLPLLPLIFTGLVIEYNKHLFNMMPYTESRSRYMDSETLNLWYQGMTGLGVFLFFTLQQLYFKPLYERLWALPK